MDWTYVKAIGDILRVYRISTGNPQSRYVILDQLSKPTISRIENGQRVKEGNIKSYMDALGVTRKDLQALEECREKAYLELNTIDTLIATGELEKALTRLAMCDDRFFSAHLSYLKGKCYTRLKQPRKGIDAHKKALDLLPASDPLTPAICNELGLAYYYDNHFAEAIRITEQAIEFIASVEEPFTMLRPIIHINLTVYLDRVKKEKEAYLYLKQLWDQRDTILITDVNLNVHDMMMKHFIANQEFQEAKKVIYDALYLARINQKTDWFAVFWSRLGEWYFAQGQQQLAIPCLNNALEFKSHVRDRRRLLPIYQKIGEVRCACGLVHEATEAYRTGIQIAEEERDTIRKIELLVSYGKMLKTHEQLDHAKALYQEAMELARTSGSVEHEREAVYQMTEIAHLQNNDDFQALSQVMFQLEMKKRHAKGDLFDA
ncbi:helix-turn-helix domain-containing protein [Marininema halotolerans]|uniref:HTH cro/C1-type domain-containing protein n=1 Tax=Marininema halotolerans TaxID=1155944 RepID=A0A1I6SFU5_9BACL|nr:helix-turn-helix transcriptional regulator [Marininema halotolerans]SFS75789.1 hypothetical protein SAMN05444972_10752 [Marininema halotolerans]